MNISKPLIRCIWSVALLLGSTIPFGTSSSATEIPGFAANLQGFDAREIAMLPRYCIYTQLFRSGVPGGNNPAEIERWYSVMGLDNSGAAHRQDKVNGRMFHHMHHYCFGLMDTNRATILARSRQDRQHYLGESIKEFDYIIQHAPPDFVLLPEILTKKGENLLLLGKPAEGAAELQRAIELKPDYWPPYESLSEHYRTTGLIAKAREVLKKGLSFSPKSKTLKLRLAELNAATDMGKPSPKSIKSPQDAKP